MGLFAAILFWLGIISAYSTSYIEAGASERTFFVSDSVWMNLAAVLVVAAVLAVCCRVPAVQQFTKRIETDEVFYKRCRKILLYAAFGMAVFWIFATQYRPGADQMQVQKAVYMLHTKDYSLFAEDGYLAMYPNQLGLLGFSYLLSLIFGSYNYLVFQLCNAAGIVVIQQKLADICGHCGLKRTIQLAVIMVCMLFFPLTMYSSFVYGNVLGLSFALAAIEKEMVYFNKKRKVDLLFSGLLIALAIQLKSNYLIFLIGMVLYAGVELIKEKKLRWILVPLVLIVCHTAASTMVTTSFERVSGYSLDQGASPWSWIAMGLQEGTRAPGWYNGYNSKSYKDSGYNRELQAEAAKEHICETVDTWMKNKDEALEFFTRKTASQWNNPTFQAFWNIQVRSTSVMQSEWMWGLTNVSGTHRCAVFLNLLQFVILFGALLFCLFGRRGAEQEKVLVLPMIFIGGFIFHLFWEAKCQYTISYFVLLVPYAVSGFETFLRWMRGALAGQGDLRKAVRVIGEQVIEKQFPAIVFAFVLINVSIFLFGGGKLAYLTEDAVEYSEYLEKETASPAVKEGEYVWMTKSGMRLGLGDVLEDGTREIGLGVSGSSAEIEVINYHDTTWLRFTEESLYVTVVDHTVPERQLVRAAKVRETAEPKWQTVPCPDGGFYLMQGKKYALTYSEADGQVFLAPFTEEDSQVWYMVKP